MANSLWTKMLGENEQVTYEFTIGTRYRILKLSMFLLPIFLIVATIGYFRGVEDIFFLGALGVGIAIAFILLLYYQFYIPHTNRYALTDKRMIIHIGLLNTHTTTIEYSKVTDVAIAQSFVDKLITNTGSIHINTAGSSGHEVVLAHIENPFEVKRNLGDVM